MKKKDLFKTFLALILVFCAFQIREYKNSRGQDLTSIVENIKQDFAQNTSMGTSGIKITKVSNDSLMKIAVLNHSNPNNSRILLEFFLEEMGFPKDIIFLKLEKIIHKGLFSNEVAGWFYFPSGEMIIDETLVSDPIQLAATIRHELDHFEKAAQICKSFGIEKFSKYFNPDEFNYEFWKTASQYAKTADFDVTLYHNALLRSAQMEENDTFGAYAYYFNKSEDLRNPLEISAYAISEQIYKAFGKEYSPAKEKKIVEKFNKIDWQIYNFTEKDSLFKNSRIILFDYLYMKNMTQNDEELALFYKEKNPRFYSMYNRRLSYYTDINPSEESNKINETLNLLENMLMMTQKQITQEDIKNAYEFKFETLLLEAKRYENISKENLKIKRLLKQMIDDYMEISHKYNLVQGSQLELRMLLLKIYFENGKISRQQRQKIYSNKEFTDIMQKNKIPINNQGKEYVLKELLRQTSF